MDHGLPLLITGRRRTQHRRDERRHTAGCRSHPLTHLLTLAEIFDRLATGDGLHSHTHPLLPPRADLSSAAVRPPVTGPSAVPPLRPRFFAMGRRPTGTTRRPSGACAPILSLLRASGSLWEHIGSGYCGPARHETTRRARAWAIATACEWARHGKTKDLEWLNSIRDKILAWIFCLDHKPFT
jgi:hypothetical protein